MKKLIRQLLLVIAFLIISVCSATTRAEAAELKIGGSQEETQAPSVHDGSSIDIGPAYRLPFSYNTVLAPKYDGRTNNMVTPVKNQGDYNTCWAFSTISAAETNLIKKGLFASDLDLSELQLSYTQYNKIPDPLGNTVGDSYRRGKDLLNEGGNSITAAISLSTWMGVVKESDVPYSRAASVKTSGISQDDYFKNTVAHLQNSYWINMNDTSDVKNAIMDFGSVATSYYEAGNDNGPYYNKSTYAYYCSGREETNHSVTIVGWDDNFSKTNFKTQPTGNGAWLIKNSWGTGERNSGYFWISYYDKSILSLNAYAFDFETAANYKTNYQYDGGCAFNYMYLYNPYNQVVDDTIYHSNIFKSVETETLDAVSFYTNDTNVTYSIQIYKNVTGNNPSSGQKVFSSEQTGSEKYMGYHTVNLSKKVDLAKDEKYAVVIKLQKKGSPTVVSVDTDMSMNGMVAISYSQTGQSFIGEDTKSWIDVSAKGNVNVRIKAFTKKYEQKVKASDITGAITTAFAGNETQLISKVAPANADFTYVTWSVKTAGSTGATVKNNVLTTQKPGQIILRATIKSGLGANIDYVKEFTVTVNKMPISNIKVSIPSKVTYTGKYLQPTMNVTFNSKRLKKDRDYTIKYKNNKKTGKASITITGINNCFGSKVVNFYIVPKKLVVNSAVRITKTKVKISLKKPIEKVSGYEIQLSTSKNFKKTITKVTNKRTYTVTKLASSKTYYVRIRSFIKDGSKKIYGSFSKTYTLK